VHADSDVWGLVRDTEIVDEVAGMRGRMGDYPGQPAGMLGSPLVEAPLNEFGVRLVLGEDDRLADPVPTGHGVSLAHQGRQHLVHQPTTADSARLDPRAQALGYFASVARVQYYFDGKRRTARLMMAGHRIASGYE